MITQNIIGYRISGNSEKRLQSIEAATLAALPDLFVPATAQETDEAVSLACKASRTFRNMGDGERASFLLEIAAGIESLGDVLINKIRQETAYPEARIIVERNRTCAQLRMFADIAASGSWREITVDPALPDRSPAPRPELQKGMIPLGPVVVFGASNFPLAYSTAGGDVASALAVGCPVIVKAHDAHLGTNALVAEVIMQSAIKTGMPEGVFSSLIGDGFETGRLLVQHPGVKAVGFTGSQSGGRALFDLGQRRPVPIPVFAEMGSINPVFILNGPMEKDPRTLAQTLAGSITMTGGQFCTNPGLQVVLQSPALESYLHQLKDAVSVVPESVMLTSGISATFRRGVASVREQEGVHMIFEPQTEGDHAVSPALAMVTADIFLRHPSLHHEIFGPYSLIVVCPDISEMVEVAEALEGQLTASIHATREELTTVKPLADILMDKAGRIIMNGVPTGVEVCAAMTHGGPYPASTDSRFTAVGHHAVKRWIRPVTFQNFYPELLPDALRS